jgi:hypothetical protein
MTHNIIRWMLVLSGSIIADLALAADLVALGQLLTPAYTAMSYDRLCHMNPEWQLSAPRGLDGDATNYAEHAKDETIASLTYEQSLLVVRLAADAARTEARRQLQENVMLNDKAAESIRFKAWCNGHAKNFIAGFINKYESDRASFVQKLDAAKRVPEP